MRHEHQGLPCSGKDCVKANPPKVRPGRVTDAMVEAYAETVAGMDGGRASVIREGLVAAFTQRATEIRDASTMTREQRIAERTRDLLDEIVSVELHPINYDPYPASVGEVADEIARYVLELNDSGAAQGLILELMRRLPLAATIAGAEQARLDDCTHGADCTVHPGTGQVHNFDLPDAREVLARISADAQEWPE